MKSYDLTLAAEEELRDIWRYTYETWGLDQAEKYFDQIEDCCEAVGEGRARSRSFSELPNDVRIYRCEHHYIVWLNEERPIIIAVLHARMDFVQRLKNRL